MKLPFNRQENTMFRRAKKEERERQDREEKGLSGRSRETRHLLLQLSRLPEAFNCEKLLLN